MTPALFKTADLSKLQYVQALIALGLTDTVAAAKIFRVPARVGALAPQLVLVVVAIVELALVTMVEAPERLTTPVPVEASTPSVQYRLLALIVVPFIAISEPPLIRGLLSVTVAPASVENLAPVL